MNLRLPILAAMVSALLMVSLAFANDSIIERHIPDTVTEGDIFDVTIEIPEDIEYSVYILEERVDDLGDGLEFSSCENCYYNEEDSTIRTIFPWSFEAGDDGRTVIYSLKAVEGGSYGFNGNINIDKENYAIEGDIKVNVIGECQESWECTEWSECISGERTRQCRDVNLCGTDVNRSATTEACEAVEDNSNDSDDSDDGEDDSGSSSGSSSGGSSSVTYVIPSQTEINDTVETDNITDEITNTEDTDEDIDEEKNTTGNREGEESETEIIENTTTESAEFLPENESVQDMITGKAIAAQSTENDTAQYMSDNEENDAGMPIFTKALIAIILLQAVVLMLKRYGFPKN